MTITGPITFCNLTEPKDHIQLSPRIVKDKANFFTYTNSKGFYDLQIMTLTGGFTYDIYNNYNKLFRAFVAVGSSQLATAGSIQDVDILYLDGERTKIAAFAVF